jgi:hypothetical protein
MDSGNNLAVLSLHDDFTGNVPIGIKTTIKCSHPEQSYIDGENLLIVPTGTMDNFVLLLRANVLPDPGTLKLNRPD